VSATCRRCAATWSGLRIEHCTICHETFTGTSAGDAHRVPTETRTTANGRQVRATWRSRCLTPDEMTAAGMRRNDRGQWSTGADRRWGEADEEST